MKLLVKMTDGRVGFGTKYTYRKVVYYVVQGPGFYLGDVLEADIKEVVPIARIFKK